MEIDSVSITRPKLPDVKSVFSMTYMDTDSGATGRGMSISHPPVEVRRWRCE